MRSNVLLIVLDTARADELEAPDAPPALAQLARRGLAVQGAHSTASWTLPSHASMFTGLLPRAVGLTHAPARTPGSCHGAMESQRDRLVAEVVRRAGYATAAASANLWVSPASGFDIGFDEFVSIGSGRQA